MLYYNLEIAYFSVLYQTNANSLRADGDPVFLAIYYESLCPDSRAFVRNQLSVTYPELKTIMDVDINAYGKATVSVCERATKYCRQSTIYFNYI